MSWFGALRELDFDHLNLRDSCLVAKPRRIESTIPRSTAEISRSDLIDEIGAALAMIDADATLASIMAKPPALAPVLKARMALAEREPKLMPKYCKATPNRVDDNPARRFSHESRFGPYGRAR